MTSYRQCCIVHDVGMKSFVTVGFIEQKLVFAHPNLLEPDLMPDLMRFLDERKDTNEK